MEEEFRDRVALTTAEYGEQVDTAFRVSVQKDIIIVFNIELDIQSLFGLHVTWCAQLFSLAEKPQPPSSPRIWAHIYEGRYWSAKIDDISL